MKRVATRPTSRPKNLKYSQSHVTFECHVLCFVNLIDLSFIV